MKRRVLIVLLLLVAGAIVNVAVTTALWVWGERPIRGTFEAFDYWQRRPSTAADAATWRRLAGDEWPSPIDERETLSQSKFGMRFALMVAATNSFNSTNLTVEQWRELAKQRTFYSIESTACGWPLVAASVAEAHVSKGMPPTFATWDDSWRVGNLRIPRHVSIPNFAINTVFYALALWLLFAAPFALRRRRRIKRGLCRSARTPSAPTNAAPSAARR